MADRIQLRGDIALNWTNSNPLLADREIALETDTNQIKLGNGLSHWVSLPYGGIAGTPASITSAQLVSVDTKVSLLSAIIISGLASIDGRATSLDNAISVVSNALSVVGARVNTLSDAVSNETSNRVSASAVLDAKISTLSALVVSGLTSVDGRVTSLETRISTISANYMSVDNRVSAVSGIAAGAETHAGTASAAATSADGHANTVSIAAAAALSVGNAASANAASVGLRLASVLSTTISAHSALLANVSARSGGASVRGLQAALNAISYSLSVEALKINDIEGRVSAISNVASNALSVANAVSIVAAEAATSAELATEISNRVSVSAVLDAKISTLSALVISGIASVDARITSVAGMVGGGSITSAEYLSLVNRVSVNSAAGGGGSVTSAEISALELRVSTLSTMMPLIIVSTTAPASLPDGYIWIDSDGSIEDVSAQLVSVSAVLDGKISTLSALVVSGLASVDGRVTSVGNAVSVVSNALSAVEVRVSAVSAVGVSLANAISVLSQKISVVSNALSVAISALTNASTAGSLAAISLFTSVSATLNARITSIGALGAGSVTSNKLSIAMAGVPATSAAFDAKVSNLSVQVQALSANITYQGQVSLDRFSMAFMSAAATISASAITAVLGTTIQVSSGSFYVLQGMFGFTHAAGVAAVKLGLTMPNCTMLKGQMNCTGSVGQGALAVSLKNYSQPILVGMAGGSSTILSVVSTTGTEKFVMIDAILNPSSTGNIIFMLGAAGGASAAIVQAGGFLRTEKLR